MKKIKSYLHIPVSDLLVCLIAISLALIVVSVSTYYYFASALTTKESIMNNHNTGLVLLDSSGKPFFEFYQAHYANFIPISQIPSPVQQAVVVAEDKEFYHHPGFSIKALVGALIANVRKNNFGYGGSTITQQLVKNSFLNSQKSFLRKYQEIILAQEIERRYSKREILEMYLNSVYFGQGAFGIEAASETYFQKPAAQLDLAESALLAGLLTAPSKLSPISGDPSLAKSRQIFILNGMVDSRIISPLEALNAKNEQLTFNPNPSTLEFKAPHFALMVKSYLDKKYGEENIARSGYVVKTTLDLDWQAYSEKVLATQVDELKPNQVSNGAVVVEEATTGEIKALVGSKDWNNSEFGKVNVTTSLRQPGSSFKPIVYAKALENKTITPATVLQDSPITYKPGPNTAQETYTPHDYDNKFRGPVLARRALVNSLNIPAVEVMQKIGVPAALDMARRLGITTLKDASSYGLSLALGSGEVSLLELTNAYSSFANQGFQNPPTTILEIRDKKNQVIYQYKMEPKQVLDPAVAFQISSILSDNATRAEEFGTLLNVSRPAAVKTGTTEDYRDSLTIGFTPSLVVGVWVGNNNGQPMDKIAGSIGAAPIWKALIEKFSEGKAVEKFTPPSGMVKIPVCKSNGLKAKEGTSSAYFEYFIPGTEPRSFCNTSSSTPSANPAPSIHV